MSTLTDRTGLTGMTDLTRAEWLKVRTTRLLHGTLPTAVAISAAAVAGVVVSADADELTRSHDIRDAISVTGSGAIVVLVAGIVLAAGEHRHGTAVDTFLTTPLRQRVVAAKLAVGAGLGLLVGLVTAVATVGVAAAVYSARGVTFPLGDGDVWAGLAGTLVYTTLFGVLGVGVGSLVRNQVTAVTAALAWVAVVEHILVGFATSLGRWFPFAAGQAVVRTPLDDLLTPLAGAAVLTLYAVAFALAGVRATTARDL
jgi:ABC-2 type transport system permease protein